MADKRMIPIWFFIGVLLLIYGFLILFAGISTWNNPPAGVVLHQLHAGVWWGILLIAIGAYYCLRFRPRPR